MSRPARSLFVFGIYVLFVGSVFILMPAELSSILRLPPATVGWARVIGLLALVIGAYDTVGARAECTPYIRASIPVRLAFACGTALLVVGGQMPATILLLAATDSAGALWTAFAIRASARSAVAT